LESVEQLIMIDLPPKRAPEHLARIEPRTV
jgi:hypothetical protein